MGLVGMNVKIDTSFLSLSILSVQLLTKIPNGGIHKMTIIPNPGIQIFTMFQNGDNQEVTYFLNQGISNWETYP